MENWIKFATAGFLVGLIPAVVYWDVSASMTYEQNLIYISGMMAGALYGVSVMVGIEEKSCQKAE